jgi:hypothetical protein
MVIVLAGLLASCTTNASRTPGYASPSHLISSKLVGVPVIVSGYLRFSAHERQVWDSEAAYQKGDFEQKCLTLLDTNKFRTELNSLNGKSVKMSGVVRDTSTDEEVDLGACGNHALVLDSVD